LAVAAFSGIRASLDGQIARLSPNERRLLTGLSALIPLGALFLAYNFQQSASQAHSDAQTALESARQAAGRSSGANLAHEIDKTRAEVRAWSWQGSSVAVAQVKAQSDVARMAATAGLANPEVKTSDRLETAGDVTFAPIEITAPFSWSGLSGLMSGLAASGKGFVLEEVQLTGDKEPKLRVNLKAPLVVAPVAAPKAGST